MNKLELIIPKPDAKIALITSAINPAISTHKTDSQSRLNQMLSSLIFLYEQKIFDQVILIDGSGYDLSAISNDETFKNGWIKCHSFSQNVELVNKYGYGYGELLIYDEFSRLLSAQYSHIYKISGRYGIDNLKLIVDSIASLDNFFFTYYPRFMEYRKYVHTAFYKISTKDLMDATTFAKKILERHRGLPLERAMCEWVLNSKRKRMWRRVPLPRYEGVSGATGLSLYKKSFPYNVFSRLDFLPIMGYSVES
jgi:hypothetical protein